MIALSSTEDHLSSSAALLASGFLVVRVERIVAIGGASRGVQIELASRTISVARPGVSR